VALQAQAEDIARTHERLVRGQRIAALGNWEWDLEHERVHWSDEVFRIFGIEHTLRPAGFATFIACVHPQDRPRVRAALRRCLVQGLPCRLTHRVLRPDGGERIVDENAELTRDARGRPLRLIGTVMDVTEREQALHALHRSEKTLRRVVEGLPMVVWMLDAEGRFLLSEGRGLQLMGRRPGEALGESLFERYADAPEIVADTRRVLGGEDFACVWQLGSLWFETRYSPLRDACGQVSGAIGVAMDITERKRSEDRLAYLASYDTVTGLPNRSLFQDRLAQALHRAERDSHQAALLFIDLDNFKHVNDTLGHAAGDALLQQVAARLKGALRASDSVSRLGGDEFTVILETIWRDEDVEQVAAKLLQESALPYRLQGQEVFVTASIGIAVYPRDGDNAEALLMSADAAMYRAKDRGRHGYEFSAQAISARSQERLSLGNELRGALARGEFSLHYQPKAALQGGRVLGFEALLRWHNARLGTVSPAVFIPVLEDTGLIAEVGAWVLAEACRWAAQAPPAGVRPTTVSVNLSARQFRQGRLVETIRSALAETGLEAERLELELTESTIMGHGQEFVAMLAELKSLGVRVAIDDFGTGYSNLSYLSRFPIDALKIDRSFVSEVATDQQHALLAKAVISLGHSLRLKVVAEGVETAEQLDFLRHHGCDEVQGYFFSRPVPPEEFERMLARWPAAN
jgi:diguanylate cyclase (GGDEF)-like protein/PAS domain S-box-containing protein